MTSPRPCPPAPGPLEPYAAHFDRVFGSLAQRRSFRAYLTGLLLPRDRHKTLTALAGAEPVVEAQAAAVQRLQFFLSEASWDAAALDAQRLALLAAEPAIAPHAAGVLVLDDTGDRKDGHATAHVARQYLGSVGKIDRGIVAVTSLWAGERYYHPLHAAAIHAGYSGCPRARPTRRFVPSRSWRWRSSSAHAPPACRFGRWWLTASTAITAN